MAHSSDLCWCEMKHYIIVVSVGINFAFVLFICDIQYADLIRADSNVTFMIVLRRCVETWLFPGWLVNLRPKLKSLLFSFLHILLMIGLSATAGEGKCNKKTIDVKPANI